MFPYQSSSKLLSPHNKNKLIISNCLFKVTINRNFSSSLSSKSSRRFNPFSHEPYIIPSPFESAVITKKSHIEDYYNASNNSKYTKLIKNQSFRDLINQVINYNYIASSDGTIAKIPLTSTQLAKYEYNSIRKLSVRLGGPYKTESKQDLIQNVENILIENTQNEEKRKLFELRNHLLTKSRKEIQLLAIDYSINGRIRTGKIIDSIILYQTNPTHPDAPKKRLSEAELEAKMGPLEYQALQLSKRRTNRDLIKYCQSIGVKAGAIKKIETTRRIIKYKQGKLEIDHFNKKYLKSLDPVVFRNVHTLSIGMLARMLGLVYHKVCRYDLIARVVRHQNNRALPSDYLVNHNKATATAVVSEDCISNNSSNSINSESDNKKGEQKQLQSNRNSNSSSIAFDYNNNYMNSYSNNSTNKEYDSNTQYTDVTSEPSIEPSTVATTATSTKQKKSKKLKNMNEYEPLLLRTLTYDMLVHLCQKANLPTIHSTATNDERSIVDDINIIVKDSSNNTGTDDNINNETNGSNDTVMSSTKDKSNTRSSNNNSCEVDDSIDGISTNNTTQDILTIDNADAVTGTNPINNNNTNNTNTAPLSLPPVLKNKRGRKFGYRPPKKIKPPADNNINNLTRSELIQQLMRYITMTSNAVLDTPSLIYHFKRVNRKYVKV